MKRICTFLGAVVIGVFLISGCKPKVKPLSEIIGKVWSAQVVKEGSAVVYTKGGTNNVQAGYINFRLDLSSPTSVTYKERDGNTFTGQWELQEGTTNTLVLKNLTPQPTGTSGTITFTINSSSETEFVITRTTASQKTGGTINNYTLVTP
ncbi:hypothetical protein [Runella sp.]|jgi:hypothetical protein|uniref:hypothetical protein n=1 Tax=Runella sp. TaxID=1960881 RepID=UPI00260CB392|nr:hypothetical protein [Runella sp.]